MSRPYPDANLLGWGYNVFEDYADARSTTRQLMDLGPNDQSDQMGEYTYTRPSMVTQKDLSEGHLSVTYGQSISSYQNSLSVSAGLSGSYGFFKGSVKARFKMDQSGSSFNEYMTQEDRTSAFLLSLPLPEQLRANLIEPFKSDLETLAPNDLFAKYGTHYLAEFIGGGVAQFNAITTKFTNRTEYEMGLDVNAQFQRLGYGASAEISSEAMTENKYEESYKSSEIYIHGGDENMRDQVMNGGMGDWEQTVNSNPVMIDFTEHSLVGIWELASTSARREALQNAYPAYASNYKPYTSQSGKALRVSWCNSYDKVWDDHKSGAKMDVSLFQPLPRQGYYALNGLAVSGHPDTPGHSVITVQPLDSTFDQALALPESYTRVYKDSGTGSKTDGSVWRAKPPKGYVALGDVGMHGHSTEPAADAIMCVHESLVSDAVIGNEIWTDKNSHGDQDETFWLTQETSTESQVPYGAFIAQKGYSKPGDSLAYAIDNAVLEQ